jgi:uracil-DNA glycosylase family 4
VSCVDETEGKSLDDVAGDVIQCSKCPRLSSYIRQVGETKVKRFVNDEYWSKPVPGFGDKDAEVVIVGLAPAAHGGNRTGRMFTGDSSGQWLMKALFEIGYANMPASISKHDGLILKNVYITSIVKCAPPSNKPSSSEISDCSRYLKAELALLERKTKVIIALGRIAFKTVCDFYGLKGLEFRHGACYEFGKKYLLVSYHPSRQNTNTKKLSWEMWIEIFRKANSLMRSF